MRKTKTNLQVVRLCTTASEDRKGKEMEQHEWVEQAKNDEKLEEAEAGFRGGDKGLREHMCYAMLLTDYFVLVTI